MLQFNGYAVTVTRGRSSRATQKRLYRNFLAGKSKYPAAPPGHSLHERGLAFDMLVSPEAGQRLAGEAWERLGGRWGGRFSSPPDPIHFEARMG